MQLAIVIMAAGKGTRLKSRRPKVLHQIGGRALVEHVIAAAAQVVEPKDIYVVIGHEAEAVRAALLLRCTTTQGPAWMTVAGMARPSSA